MIPMSIIFLLGVATIWFLWCNETTFAERRFIIRAIFDTERPQFMDRLTFMDEAQDQFQDVGYDRHLLNKFLFIDGYQLYGPRVQALIADYEFHYNKKRP